MKKIFYLLAIIILASCGQKNTEGEADKQTMLNDYKQQLHELKLKINELEKELQADKEIEYVNVKVQEVRTQLFEHFIDVTGSVEADQEVNVSPEGSGKIVDILVKEGQQVKKGTVLATLNTDILDQSIEEVKISLDLANTTFERQKNLWEQKIGSELQFLQAKTNKESLEHRLESLEAQKEMTMVKSPVDGVVDVIYQKKGQIANPQMPFAKVVNISKLKVYAEVAESYLTKIKKGDLVTIDFPALDMEIKAPITMIGNFINPDNRTFRVRIDLVNKSGLIKPNLLSIVKIRDYVSEDAIVVPSLLVKEDFKGEYMFVVKSEGDKFQAEKIYVKSGISDNNLSEITTGLETGVKVISEGFNQVVNGTFIQF